MSGMARWRQQIPTTPGSIQRPRLMEQLRALEEFPIVLITAPPGYGKTTLAAHYAGTLDRPVIWHMVSSRDMDLPYLHRHGLRLLSSVLGSDTGPAPSDTRQSPAEVANQMLSLLEQYQEPVLYVLDDVHHLLAADTTTKWLQFITSALPANVRLLVISRTLPPLQYSELLIHSQIASLEHEYLRFSLEEVEALATNLPEAVHDAEQINYLLNRLDGWPAGVAMALQPTSALHHELPQGTEPLEALFETLAKPVVQHQLPDMKRFLLASSTFEIVTPDLCENVLGIPGAASLLKTAYQRGLFLSRVEGGYTYHSLFRDYLQKLLKAEDPTHYSDYHLVAARRYEERDVLEAAFDHYLLAGQRQQSVEIAERAASAFYAEGHHERVLRWYQQLQQEQADVPNLCLTAAWVYTDRYNYDEAVSALVYAEKRYREKEDQQGIAEVTLQRGRILFQRGEYAEAKDTVRPILDVSSPSHRGRALRIMGSSNLWLGNLQVSIDQLEESRLLHEEAGLISALSHVLQDLYLAYSELGDLDIASDYLQHVVAIRRKLGGKGALALALNDLGWYYHLRTDYESAYQVLTEGIEVAASGEDRRSMTFLLASLADLHRDMGHFSRAVTLYDQAVSLLNPSDEPRLHRHILLSLSRMRFWQGRYHEAATLCMEAVEITASTDLQQDAGLVQAQMFLIQFFLGEEDALESLHNLVGELPSVDTTESNRINAELSLALAYLEKGEQSAAREVLGRVLNRTQEIDSPHAVVAELFHNTGLAMLLADLPGVSLVTGGLDRLQAAALKIPHTVEPEGAELETHDTTTGHLEILTLGRERIKHSDGFVITEADWRTNSAREAFFYLLMNGGASRDELGLFLWPDGDPEQVKSNVYLTVHRIRQAVGHHTILNREGVYTINPGFSIWCDAFEFEEFVEKASRLPPHDARAEELWRKAVILYKGELLPSLEGLWLTARRESLEESHIRALINYGQCAYTRGDYDTALSRYMNALEADALREETHRAIMKCYAAKGENSQVAAHYSKLKDLMRHELDVLPSEKTEHLVKQILVLQNS